MALAALTAVGTLGCSLSLVSTSAYAAEPQSTRLARHFYVENDTGQGAGSVTATVAGASLPNDGTWLSTPPIGASLGGTDWDRHDWYLSGGDKSSLNSAAVTYTLTDALGAPHGTVDIIMINYSKGFDYAGCDFKNAPGVACEVENIYMPVYEHVIKLVRS